MTEDSQQDVRPDGDPRVRDGPGRDDSPASAARVDPAVDVRLYLLAVVVVSALVIGLLYALFTGGFVDIVQAFLADPAGALQDYPFFVVALLGVFASVFVLIALVVVVGAQHVDPGRVEERAGRDDPPE